MSDAKLKPVDFTALILGFCSATLSYLGYGGEALSKNLDLAQQNIDIIEMLVAKTKGNLTAEEDKLCREVLTDLRMKFVEARKS